jgi:U3 small nucleolar RNA-associated protein 14
VNGVNTSFTFTVNPITDFVKCALKYKNNDCSLWVNGVEISNSTSQIAFPINTLTKLSFTSGSSSSNFYGNTKDLKYYPKALSDAELINLTTI